MTLEATLDRLRELGYEPSEPRRLPYGGYAVTMPGKLNPGTLTLVVDVDGYYHAPGHRDQTRIIGAQS